MRLFHFYGDQTSLWWRLDSLNEQTCKEVYQAIDAASDQLNQAGEERSYVLDHFGNPFGVVFAAGFPGAHLHNRSLICGVTILGKVFLSGVVSQIYNNHGSVSTSVFIVLFNYLSGGR